MSDLTTLATFFGWSTVLNIGLLIFAAFVLVVFNVQVKTLHVKYITFDTASLNTLYFSFLGYYKLAIIMLNLVPCWALKIML